MSITNAQIAQSISDLLDKWWTRENQYQDWLNGTATGGPYSNGTYPLTGKDGVTRYVKCPAALQASVDGQTSSAQSYSTQAGDSATQAASSASAAQAAQTAAESARDAAQLAQQLADTAKANAANSASNAQVYANNASSSASAAATSADNASTSETNAAASEANALTSEANAASYATNADTSASNAAASETLAQKYAVNPEDVIVQGSDYSAYHWAQKAKVYSTGTLVFQGTLDASSGSYPASPRQGDFYIISVGGTLGTITYAVGDMALYDGSAWDRVNNNQLVTSVAGRVGDITLSASDIAGVAALTGAAFTGIVSATSFNGPLVGDVTGNVTGNLTGMLNAIDTNECVLHNGITNATAYINYRGAPSPGISLYRFCNGLSNGGYADIEARGATFHGSISATNLSGTNTGDQSLSDSGFFKVPASSSTDWNSLTTPGVYLNSNASNSPNGTSEYFYVIVLNYSSASQVVQIATSYTASGYNGAGGVIWTRTLYSGTWGHWTGVGSSIRVQPSAPASAYPNDLWIY